MPCTRRTKTPTGERFSILDYFRIGPNGLEGFLRDRASTRTQTIDGDDGGSFVVIIHKASDP